MESVEVPQPQVAMPVSDKAHHLLGPEPLEATAEEEVWSARADPSVAAPSAPAPEVPTTSAQQ